MWTEYVLAGSVEEALNRLKVESSRLIAGGTDLLTLVRSGRIKVKQLVDISRIAALHQIQECGDSIIIGTGNTHAELMSSPIIREMVPTLITAAAALGSPQIRNQGTVGGNVINGHASADVGTMLLALGAEMTILKDAEKRVVGLADFYTRDRRYRIDSSRELVTEIRLPKLKGSKALFKRMGNRSGFSRAKMVVAGVVGPVDHDGYIENARLVITPVLRRYAQNTTPCLQCNSDCKVCIPIRASRAEETLRESKFDLKTIHQVAEAAAEDVNPRDSRISGSMEYRRHIVKSLVVMALTEYLASWEQGDLTYG